MYIIPYIIYLFYLFVAAHSCELMYNKDNDKVYLCDASKNIPSNCFVFWENDYMSFCAVENTSVIPATQLNMSNFTVNKTNSIAYNNISSIYTNLSTELNSTNSTNIRNISSNYTNFANVTTILTANASINASINEIIVTTVLTKNASINANSTTMPLPFVTNLSTDNFTTNMSSDYYFYSRKKGISYTDTAKQTTSSYAILIFIGMFLCLCYGYQCRKKFKNKQLKKPLPKKKTEKEQPLHNQEQQQTLKKRSLSMPMNERESIKWKKNPFHKKNSIYDINIDNILLDNLHNNVVQQTILPNRPIVSNKEEEIVHHENVLEECEILLSSIQEDDLDEFEDVEEDLPLPTVAPPMIKRDTYTVSSPKPSL